MSRVEPPADEKSSAKAAVNAPPVEMISPHSIFLQLEYIDNDEGVGKVKMPYADILVGDPDTGIPHGGVITTMLDTASGKAVKAKISQDENLAIATLDLRIDYMQPAEPGGDLFAQAECYKTTANVAFVKGVAWQNDINDPIATSVGTFMIGTMNTPRK
ncbi:MAG: PaaI family thioesterase [Pseudomonadales bacterium]|nr:PaaI family thioesterase [Pseudomonadales bacterium]